jgi:hypothetical protein
MKTKSNGRGPQNIKILIFMQLLIRYSSNFKIEINLVSNQNWKDDLFFSPLGHDLDLAPTSSLR